MKKIRRTRIRVQTNELLIVRRDVHDDAQHSSADDEQDSTVKIRPLCHSPLLAVPELSKTIAAADSAEDEKEL